MTAAKVAYESRPAHIDTLVNSVDRYNPSNCHLLEDYLQEQLSKHTYDLLANLALLKLYQFNPTLVSPNAVLSVLFLSIVHAPFSPDFSLAWSLLSDSFVVGGVLPPPPPPPPSSDDDEDDEEEDRARAPAEPAGEKETAEAFKKLSSLLQARKFKAFWLSLSELEQSPNGDNANSLVFKNVSEITAQSQGFHDVLRGNIATEIEQSFTGIALKTLQSFLGLEPSSSSDSLKTILAEHSWSLEGDVVHIPTNESNSPTSTLQRENIEIDQLSRVLERSAIP